MASDGKQVEIWKTVVGVGGGLIAVGASLLLAASARTSPGHLETYGLAVLIGGLALVVLGLVYAFWQQHEWRRPPRLARGLRCQYFPVHYDPERFPRYPHYQMLVIGNKRPFYPPDLRVFCSAPIRNIDSLLTPIFSPFDERKARPYHPFIDAVSLHFPPLAPIETPSSIKIWVFSDEPIRVKRIKKLKTKYPVTGAPLPQQGDHSDSTASEQSPQPSQESSE